MTARHVDIFIRGHDQASRAVRTIGGAVGGFTSQLFSLRGAIAAVFSGVAISSAIEEFGKEELATRRLSDALAVLGDTRKESRAELKSFASEIQASTTVADDEVTSIMALGAALGRLEGDQLKAATKSAIGLSKALGIDTTAAMRLVARAAIGDTQMLARYGIKLDETLSPQEKFNQLLAIGARNFSLATGEAQTATGQWAQFKNRVGDLKEEIGAAFLPVVVHVSEFFEKRLFPIVRVLVNWWEKWGMTLAKSIALLGAIRLAVLGIANAHKLLALGQAFVQALAGPAGWATLAVSLGVAAGAVASVRAEFRDLEREAAADMPAARASVEALRREVDALDSSAVAVSSELAVMTQRAAQVFEQTRTPQEKFNARMKEAESLFRANKISLDTYHREQAAARAEIESGESALAAYHRQMRGLNEMLADGAVNQAFYQMHARQLNATLQASLAPSIAQVSAELRDQTETFGLTSRQADIYRLKLQGASEESLKFLRVQDENLAFLEEQNALREEGVRLTEQMRTEEERRAEALARAMKLLEGGHISQQTFDRFVNEQTPRGGRRSFGAGGVTESRFLTRSSGFDVATSLEKQLAKQEQMRKELAQMRKAAEDTRNSINRMAEGAVFVRRSGL